MALTLNVGDCSDSTYEQEVYDGGVQSVPVEWKSVKAESSLYLLNGSL
jgi:hypothetical protein